MVPRAGTKLRLIPLIIAFVVASISQARSEAGCESDDITRAFEGCTAVIEDARTDPQELAVALSRRSEIFIARGELARAIADGESALELRPKDPWLRNRVSEAHRLRGEQFMQKGDVPSGLKEFAAGINADSNNHAILVSRARLHFQMNDAIAAGRDLKRAADLAPQNQAYRIGVGLFIFERAVQLALMGNLTAAIADYSLALSHGEWADLFLHRGDAYSQIGDEARALQDYERALSLGLKAPVMLRKAERSVRKAQFRAAMLELSEALQDDPQNIPLLLLRAYVYERLDSVYLARADYQKVVQLDASSTDAENGLKRLSRMEMPQKPDAVNAGSLARFDGQWIIRWKGTGENPCRRPEGPAHGAYTITIKRGAISRGRPTAGIPAADASGYVDAKGAARWRTSARTDGAPIATQGAFETETGSGVINRLDGKCSATFLARRAGQ